MENFAPLGELLASRMLNGKPHLRLCVFKPRSLSFPFGQEKGCREALFASHCTLRDLYITRLLFRLGPSSNKGFYKHENGSKYHQNRYCNPERTCGIRQAHERPGKGQQIDKKQVSPTRENHLFLPFLINESKEPWNWIDNTSVSLYCKYFCRKQQYITGFSLYTIH